MVDASDAQFTVGRPFAPKADQKQCSADGEGYGAGR